MSKRFLEWVCGTLVPASFFALFLACAPAAAQTDPCDLNGDGVVNTADVLAAVEMMRGLLHCTADVLGPGVCNLQVVKRVENASQTGLCVTGTPTLPTLSVLTLSSNVIQSGQSSLGKVTLSGGSAGSGGVLVSLTASTGAAQVPPNVLISAGSNSATFSITGEPVSEATSVTVTAYYSGVWATSKIAVNPAPVGLSGLSVNPGSFATGQTATGTIELTGVAPSGGAPVSLASSNNSISFPTTVTVPQGSALAYFTVSANLVTVATQVQLTASYLGVNSTITLTVDPASVILSWIASTSPDIAGYNVFRGTVSGGPYTQLNSSLVPGTIYVDSTVVPGLTYFYVTTAVNTSNSQSPYSNQAEATIP